MALKVPLGAHLGALWGLLGASRRALGSDLDKVRLSFTFIRLFESILGPKIDAKNDKISVKIRDVFVIEFRPFVVEEQIILKHEFRTTLR